MAKPTFTSELFTGPSVEIEPMRTASKTVRKFTQPNGLYSLPDCVSVNLDWYSGMVVCMLPEPDQDSGEIVYPLTNDITLEYKFKGTTSFKHEYQVMYRGEPVANLHTHTRNPVVIACDKAKFEILNHVLYSNEWQQIKSSLFDALGVMVPENIGRLDIAIDGVNHLPAFLNMYAKQPGRTARVKMKGRGRESFYPGRMDANHNFTHFRIGSTKGHKRISIYNKTKEIDTHSHKEYIRRAWIKCGLLNEDMPLNYNAQGQWTEDIGQSKVYGTRPGEYVKADQKEIWRCELRMDSQALKDIKDLDINRLTDPHYLLEIFATQIKNFFEFVKIEGDSNVTRAKKIDLFQFKKLFVTLLDKVPRALATGAYKAKMAIHLAIKDVLLGYHKGERAVAHILSVVENIELYDLSRWFNKRREKYEQLYGYRPHENYLKMIPA